MTGKLEEGPHLRPDDAEFVERLASSFAPPPLTPAQRVGFDEALEARLARRRRVTIPIAAFAALALAGVVAWFALPGTFGTRGSGEGEPGAVVAAASSTAEDWELEVLYAAEPSDSNAGDESDLLPEDYVAIAGAFLDG